MLAPNMKLVGRAAKNKWFIGFSVAYLVLVHINYNIKFRTCQTHAQQPTIDINVDRRKYHANLSSIIQSVYKIPESTADQIVIAVAMNADEVFTMPIILGVIATESSFRGDSVSDKDAHGYMQLSPTSGRKQTKNVFENIHEGVSHLTDYYKQLGSIENALQSYYLGIGNFRKGARAPKYLTKVLSNAKQFEIATL